MKTIGEVIKAGIMASKTNESILKDVYKAFPEANTKNASVNWYRSQMKKTAPPAPKAPKTPAKKAISTAVASTVKDAYEVRGAKATHGHEGTGFIASLYCNGNKVAIVADYADGGPVNFDWMDRGTKAVVKTVNYMDELHEYNGTVEEARFAAYCLALPKYVNKFDPEGSECHVSPDIAVDEMVNDIQLKKQLARLMKNKIAFIDGDKLMTVSTPYTTANADKYVFSKNPTAKVLNGMEEADALKALRDMQ